MKEKQDIIQELYFQISDFIRNNPDIEEELLFKEKDFLRLSFSEGNSGQFFFDWFIFDYKLKKYNKRLFDVFLFYIKKSIPKSLYNVYSGIGKDIFGFFKIKAVKTGKQFLCYDILTLTEYQVFDSSSTKIIGKGDCIIGRLLPFKDAFVVASQCLYYKIQNYDMLSMILKKTAQEKLKRIDAYDVYKSLYPENIPEKLSTEEKFILLCKEGGLSDDDIEDIFLKTKIAIKNKTLLPQEVISSTIEQIKEREGFILEEFYIAFIEVWNLFTDQIHLGAKKGPLETTLLKACMTSMEMKFPIGKNMSKKGAKNISIKINKWMKEWFVTPKEELEGKTPKQVIMQERMELGNPQKDFGFQFNIGGLSSGQEKEKKAENIFYAAAEHMKDGEYQKALKLYDDYLKLWNENHIVWHNMGVCYVMLLQKRKAESCLKMALVIKPDYDLAR
ncbi:MAG: hypothetical protein KAJ14_13990, partial [Candidatus Omnitrophica bacterium]|nr:hypothetical protein [Candidatus Omnitrophota bacterium]